MQILAMILIIYYGICTGVSLNFPDQSEAVNLASEIQLWINAREAWHYESNQGKAIEFYDEVIGTISAEEVNPALLFERARLLVQDGKIRIGIKTIWSRLIVASSGGEEANAYY